MLHLTDAEAAHMVAMAHVRWLRWGRQRRMTPAAALRALGDRYVKTGATWGDAIAAYRQAWLDLPPACNSEQRRG